jgi:hypothetical protein
LGSPITADGLQSGKKPLKVVQDFKQVLRLHYQAIAILKKAPLEPVAVVIVGGSFNVFFDFVSASNREFFTVIVHAESAFIPWAVARRPDQKTIGFIDRADWTQFKRKVHLFISAFNLFLGSAISKGLSERLYCYT